MNKKSIISIIFWAVILVFASSNSNFKSSISNVSASQTINKIGKKINFADNGSKNDDVIITSIGETYEDFLNLNYNHMTFNGINYYVADLTNTNGDVLNDSSYVYCEIKLIENPANYLNFEEFKNLRNEDYVMETIKISKETSEIKKNFTIINSNNALSIINDSNIVERNDENYYELLSSINYEYNYRQSVSKHTNNYSLTSMNSVSAPRVDEQGPLDYYLLNTSNGTTTNSDIHSSGAQTGLTYGSDDSIVSLFPRNYFMENGIKKRGGSEWGYLINTYDDIGFDKNISLIIYDIEQEKATHINAELTEITVVVHKNFKYLYKEDVIVGDIDNTYALSNPIFKENLRYFQPSNVSSSVKYLNPGDSGYNQLNDFGYSFGTTAYYLKGRNKNAGGDTAVSFLIGLASTTLQVALIPSGLSVGVQIAIGVASDLITDAIIETTSSSINEKKNAYLTDNEGYKISTATFFNSYSNYDYLRKDKKLIKEINFFAVDKNGNMIPSNTDYPLLFKDESCKISYRSSILDSEKSDDYNAILSHSFTVDVINDTSWIFNHKVTYVGTISNKWAYSFGENFAPKPTTLYANGKLVNIAFGTINKQVVNFKPLNSGQYYLYLKNVSPYVKGIVKNGEEIVGRFGVKSLTRKDSWNNEVRYVENRTYSGFVNFWIGPTYTIEVYANNGNLNLSGSCSIGISYNGANLSDVSSSTNIKKTKKNIPFNEENRIIRFTAKTDSNYIFCTSSNDPEISGGTYITLMDKNFNEIISSFDSFGTKGAYLNAYLKSSEKYYISTRNYNSSSNYSYSIVMLKGKMLPQIRGSIKNIGFNLVFNGIKNYSFLLYQNDDIDGNIRFEYLGENVGIKQYVYFSIVGYNGDILYSDSFNYTKDYKYSFTSKKPYLINVYSTSAQTNDYIDLFLS